MLWQAQRRHCRLPRLQTNRCPAQPKRTREEAVAAWPSGEVAGQARYLEEMSPRCATCRGWKRGRRRISKAAHERRAPAGCDWGQQQTDVHKPQANDLPASPGLPLRRPAAWAAAAPPPAASCPARRAAARLETQGRAGCKAGGVGRGARQAGAGRRHAVQDACSTARARRAVQKCSVMQGMQCTAVRPQRCKSARCLHLPRWPLLRPGQRGCVPPAAAQ